MARLQLAQDPAADELLEDNPLALLIAMLLDQQIPMEVAFAGPKKIADRIGGIDAHQIAEYDPDKFVALCSERPAIHRFPGSMAKRVQVLAQEIVDEYDGRAENIWKAGDPTGPSYSRDSRRSPVSASKRQRSSWPCWASSTVSSPRTGARQRGTMARRAHICRWQMSSTPSRWAWCAPIRKK